MGVSVKSGVITTSSSPRALYLPRNPPIPRLPSVSPSLLFRPTIVLDKIPIPAWPSQYSKVFKLYNSSSFTVKGCVIPEPKSLLHLIDTADKIRAKDTSLTLPEYLHYSLYHCSTNFCSTHLKCCFMCGLTSHSNKRIFCLDSCSDCPSHRHTFTSCPKFTYFYRWNLQ